MPELVEGTATPVACVVCVARVARVAPVARVACIACVAADAWFARVGWVASLGGRALVDSVE